MNADIPGLSAEATAQVRVLLAEEPKLQKAIVFGSRAKGTHKPGSDVDLALFGPRLERPDLLRLSQILNEETTLPWRFDLLLAEQASTEIQAHIARVGLCIYEREPVRTVLN